MEYVSFSDESCHTNGLFRSIAVVSIPCNRRNDVVDMSNELEDILECSRVGELKWRNVGRNNVERAKSAVDFVFSKLSQGLRVDVVIWDIEDSRHSVENRDDVANYCRMYFHLHRWLMSRRGPDTHWHLRPDRQDTITWETIYDCLNSGGAWKRQIQSAPIPFEDADWIAPKVRTLKQVDSAKTPFVQLADLFAGMATYTRTKPEVIRTLLTKQRRQLCLFPTDAHTCSTSKNDNGRFKVISYLHRLCKKKSLGVSLETDGYFSTPNPRNPINFWHYRPQHPHDKAPTKGRGVSSWD